MKTPVTLSLCLISLVGILMLGSCSTSEEQITINDKAIADEEQTFDWRAYGRTHNERRFFPADDINTSNVKDLKPDWYMDLHGDVGLVSTPLVIDGILYFVGTMNIVKAVDARSGELIWEYDPKVGDVVKDKRQIGWVHNRGISFYEGKVFAATWDGRLIAIDALTGEQIWETRTFGLDQALYITGAPKAFKGKVLIGNGGTENGPTRGYITAYDAETGEQAWRFYIVPGNPSDGFEDETQEMAAKTWTGEWWKHGGGGNTWHGFTYDEELDALYVGTGNGSPWNRKIRSPEGGDNLFLCSVVALDPDDGKYLWHYQTTPGETWDFNSNMDIVLADLNIEGEEVKALLHAPKNGFFYVINRKTGKLISAEPFADVNWASHIDMETGRPVEIEGARYEDGGPVTITPSPWGAHSWHAMSFNPMSGLVYLPVIHQATTFTDEGIDLGKWQAEPFVGGLGVNLGEARGASPSGSLVAWDPVSQKEIWSIKQKYPHNPGTLTTAGNLVFQGSPEGILYAYHAETGEALWSYDVGLGIAAPPITYKLDGKQYISLLVGWGGGYAGLGAKAPELGWGYGKHKRRLITFSLTGEAMLPKLPPPHVVQPINDPDFEISAEMAQLGAGLYGYCSACHGPGMFSGGMAPDLRESKVCLDKNAFKSVVKEGSFVDKGMPQFSHLTDEELTALMHFVRKRAKETTPGSIDVEDSGTTEGTH